VLAAPGALDHVAELERVLDRAEADAERGEAIKRNDAEAKQPHLFEQRHGALTDPVSQSDIDITASLHEIMALIARAVSAHDRAAELLEKNLLKFVPEAYDAMVEQALVASNKWREFSQKRKPDAAALEPVKARNEFELREIDELRSDLATLKSDNRKLKIMLAEQPDLAKLRKKIADQQTQMASLRSEIKKIGNECNQYRKRATKNYREALCLATRETYGVIIKVLHSDKREHITPADLAEAERRVINLKPLFIEPSA
jgi:hypothetical protein